MSGSRSDGTYAHEGSVSGTRGVVRYDEYVVDGRIVEVVEYGADGATLLRIYYGPDDRFGWQPGDLTRAEEP